MVGTYGTMMNYFPTHPQKKILPNSASEVTKKNKESADSNFCHLTVMQKNGLQGAVYHLRV